jgi:predicted DNA-binding transcriptional regulator AlpA
MGKMKYSRDQLMSPDELAANFGLKKATLADWRSQKKGPRYLKTGREVWYPKDCVDSWAEAQIQETIDGIENSRRNLALPIQTGRQNLRGNNRLGRHRTRRDKS